VIVRIDLQALLQDLVQLIVAGAVRWKGRMSLLRGLPTMEGGPPSLPDGPVFEGKGEEVGTDGTQSEGVGIVVGGIIPFAFVEMGDAAEVSDATTRTTGVQRFSSTWRAARSCSGSEDAPRENATRNAPKRFPTRANGAR